MAGPGGGFGRAKTPRSVDLDAGAEVIITDGTTQVDVDSTHRALTVVQKAQLGACLSLSSGEVAGSIVVHKFGANPSVGTTVEDIWAAGGTYTGFLTSASTVRIAAGGDANDDTAGTGAQEITILGLDENWKFASETVKTAGTSASASTTTTFIRVYRAFVSRVGTYHGSNAAVVSIETTGGTEVASIYFDSVWGGHGQTEMCIYTIPTGYIGYIARAGITVETTRSVTVAIWQVPNADDASAPYNGAKRIVFEHQLITDQTNVIFQAMPSFPARTDIWVQASTPAATASVTATMDLFLLPV